MWPTGIGFAIAKKLAQNPGNTCILTSRDRARGEKAVEDLKGEGIKIEFMQLDIGDPASVEVTGERGYPPSTMCILKIHRNSFRNESAAVFSDDGAMANSEILRCAVRMFLSDVLLGDAASPKIEEYHIVVNLVFLLACLLVDVSGDVPELCFSNGRGLRSLRRSREQCWHRIQGRRPHTF